MRNEKLGIGLIGAGLIGTLHSGGLKTVRDRNALPVELVCVADVEEDKAGVFKDIFGFGKATADPEELIKDPGVDAVFVCTWTGEHASAVEAAVDEKKHVFCEKPLSFTANEARRLRDQVVDAGLVNQVGLVLRQGPVWNVVRHMVRNDDNGFPMTCVFRDDQCFPIKGAHPSTWRVDPSKAGHGAVIEHSIHDLDLLEWIFGEVCSIRATTATRFGNPEIEDLAKIDMDFESGMTATLVSVWHDVLNRPSNRRMEVFHEKALYLIESEYMGPIERMTGPGLMEVFETAEVNELFWKVRGIDDPDERELSMMFGGYEDYLFCRSIIENKPGGPDFNIAVRAHELVDACYLSAETKSPVSTAAGK